MRIDFFIHDRGASQDPKLKVLMRRFGPAGYSVFFMVLEYLCMQDLKPIQLKEDWQQEEFALYLCLLDREREADITLLNDIIEQACNLGLFDKNQWQEKKELWCQKLEERLQERFKHKEKEAERKRVYREKGRIGYDSPSQSSAENLSSTPDSETAKSVSEQTQNRQIEERKAFEYIQVHASHAPNFQNVSWVPGFLKITFAEAPEKYPALKPENILHCWRQACDVTFERGKGPSYLKSTFHGKLREFKPEAVSASPEQHSSQDYPDYPKDRRGKYTSDLGANIFPGLDLRVPFDQLDLGSKKDRMQALGFFKEDRLDFEKLNHPEVMAFIREYCEMFPNIAEKEPLKSAYERVKANDAS